MCGVCAFDQALGEDPFRRSPVVALLPCVRLDVPHNLKLFQATLCEVGGYIWVVEGWAAMGSNV